MAKKSDSLNNSPPFSTIPPLERRSLNGRPRTKGQPSNSRGETLRAMLSFGVLKDDLGLSYEALETAYRSDKSTLIRESPKESKSFKRYIKGLTSRPRTSDGRLPWALTKSAKFAELYRSPLFDLLDMELNEDDVKDQFTCWLWRAIAPCGIAVRLRGRPPSYQVSQREFREQMTAFMRAASNYGGQERVNIKIDKSLTEIRGRCFAASVVEVIPLIYKKSTAKVLPAPYQVESVLSRLIEIDHPDALCIMLLGVKSPGSTSGIRELATQGCAAWLLRWATTHPDRNQEMQQFLVELSSKNTEIEPVIATWKNASVMRGINS